MIENKKYTMNEIHELFLADTSLDVDFKNEILSRIDGMHQGIMNILLKDVDACQICGEHGGDPWLESHDEIISKYNSYKTHCGRI